MDGLEIAVPRSDDEQGPEAEPEERAPFDRTVAFRVPRVVGDGAQELVAYVGKEVQAEWLVGKAPGFFKRIRSCFPNELQSFCSCVHYSTSLQVCLFFQRSERASKVQEPRLKFGVDFPCTFGLYICMAVKCVGC